MRQPGLGSHSEASAAQDWSLCLGSTFKGEESESVNFIVFQDFLDGLDMAGYICNPTTQEAEAKGPKVLRPAWATEESHI